MTSYLVSNLSLRCFIVYMFFISSLKDEPHILSLVFDMLFNEHQHFSLTQRLFVSAPLVMFIYRCTMFCIVFMFEYCHFNFNICISMSKFHKGKIYLCVSSSFFFKFFTLFGSKLKSSLTTFFFFISVNYISIGKDYIMIHHQKYYTRIMPSLHTPYYKKYKSL